jgi:hypothetical protein
LPPIFSTSSAHFSNPSFERAATTSLVPALPSQRATDAPTPLDAPVIITTALSSIIIVIRLYFINTLLSESRGCPRFKASKGEAVVKLLRAFGNAEDGVSSAFPQGKQNGVVFFDYLYSTGNRVVNNLHIA